MVFDVSDPNSTDDALDEFQASRRRSRLIGAGVSLAVLAVVAGVWAWWRATGLPPIDDDDAKKVSEALDQLDTIPREYHAMIAAKAMAELESERLPAAMVEAFDALDTVPPEMASLIAMRPFADDADSLKAWTVACPAGADAIVTVGQTGDIDKLFADCELGRWSLIDGTAARRLSAGRLILAHAAWGWLVEHHSETELERRILRVFVQG